MLINIFQYLWTFHSKQLYFITIIIRIYTIHYGFVMAKLISLSVLEILRHKNSFDLKLKTIHLTINCSGYFYRNKTLQLVFVLGLIAQYFMMWYNSVLHISTSCLRLTWSIYYCYLPNAVPCLQKTIYALLQRWVCGGFCTRSNVAKTNMTKMTDVL